MSGTKTNTKNRRGFTIVELLIVIVVIAILAAISIVAYNGIQNRAADAIIKSDLSSIAKKMELAKVDLGRYPENVSEMPEYKLTKSAYDTAANNAYICIDKVNQAYAFGARSKSKKGFIQASSGLKESAAGVSSELTCQAIGRTSTDTGLYMLGGYSPTGYATTNGWYPGWSWTN